MDAGALRDRVTFQELEEIELPGKSMQRTWKDLARVPTVWAKVDTLSGDEKTQAVALTASANMKLTIRTRDDLREDMRAICLSGPWRGKVLNIRQILFSQWRDKTEILAELGVAEREG